MTVQEVMQELESMGSEQTRKIFGRHNGPEKMFGVKVADLKKILKKIKKDHGLAMELYNTGNADAQYLAGLAADPKQMSREDLKNWAETASWQMVAEYSVAWNVGESEYCIELCEEWRQSGQERMEQVAWASLGAHMIYDKREPIDKDYLISLINEVVKTIHGKSNRVKYVMNGFIIAVGSAEPDLYAECMSAAKEIGKVEVFMGETSCKVPFAPEYLEKIKKMGRLGNKKKTLKC